MQYIRKVYPVDAMQFDVNDDGHADVVDFVGPAVNIAGVHVDQDGNVTARSNRVEIQTSRGTLHLTDGDWLVKDGDNFFVFNDSEFQSQFGPFKG